MPKQPGGDAKGADQHRTQEANAWHADGMEKVQGKDGEGRKRAKGPKEIQTRRTGCSTNMSGRCDSLLCLAGQ